MADTADDLNGGAAREPESKARHIPTKTTRKTVSAMTAWNLPQDDIAGILGISKRTLYRLYKEDIKLGLSKVLAERYEKMSKIANSNTRAAARANAFLIDRIERRMAQHHGTDLDRVKRDILADADVVRPSGPLPEKPVL